MDKKKKNAVKAAVSIALASGAIITAVTFRHHPYYALKKQKFDISQTENKPNELTVMSFNIRCLTPTDRAKNNWYYRADLVIENIRRTAPDIIGFQEVKIKQQAYLKELLKGYDHIISYRDNSKLTEGGPIYYRADKFILIDKGTFWLSETPDVMSRDWDSACTRICSYVILEEKSSKKQFVVFNTHLDHVSEEARVNGIGVVLDKIQQFGGLPSILMGDFNATEDSKTYKSAMEHFDDTKFRAAETMDAGTYQNWGRESEPPCIDYMMISKKGFEVDKYFVQTDTYEGVYPSDHFPVCAILQLSDTE